MSESKELKPKSFRIDEETAEKFKQISNELGNNQQATLSKLIEAYEFQKGKAMIFDKKEDIETFEKYITLLTRMYMDSLETNQIITEAVRSEFVALLNSKDTTIQDLQENVEFLEYNKKKHDEEVGSMKHTIGNMTKQIQILESQATTSYKEYERTIEDKDKLNKALTESCNNLKTRLEDLTLSHSNILENIKHAEEIQIQNHSLENEINKLNNKIEFLNSELEHASKKLIESEQNHKIIISNIEDKESIKLEKRILELNKKHQEKIESLHNLHQNEIDKYQSKYKELLERIEQENKSKHK